MDLDLRLPLGLIFCIFGFILVSVGLVGGPELVAQSLGININLWWGAVMLGFGAVMLAVSRKPRR